MAITSAQIQELYVAYLGRAADKEGLDYWSAELNAEPAVLTLENLRANFVNEQAEYTDAYAGLTRTETVSKIYLNLFGRAADDVGLAYWTTGEGASVNVDQLLVAFVNGASVADAAVVSNKVFVANTYTVTAGADYNATAAAEVIADVDGTTASVNTALDSITNGTLPGLTPGIGLINGLAAAQTAQASFETANQAAVDALAESLEYEYDVNEDTFAEQLGAVYAESMTARNAVDGGAGTSTSVLAALAGDAAKETAKTYAALDNAGKAKADAYVSAVKVANALEGAESADVTGVKAGLDADVKFFGTTSPAVAGDVELVDAAILAVDSNYTDTITNADELYTFYVDGETTAEVRSAIDKVLKDVPYYSTFKATAVIDSAKNVADQAVTDSTVNADYRSDYVDQAGAEETLADAKAADVNVDAAKAQVDSYKVQTDAVTAAKKEISDFNSDHTDVAAHDISVTTTGTDAVKDVFYFGSTVDGADFTIAAKNFGAGDSIVLGSEYTFNSGALSTGNSNVLEFFLVKGATGIQVVVESEAFGNASTEVDANGTVTSSDNASVITLTGVTADLSVANGVISFA